MKNMQHKGKEKESEKESEKMTEIKFKNNTIINKISVNLFQDKTSLSHSLFLIFNSY